MQMPGRHTESESYRYAYNGMETDNEVSGNGNSYTTEFRQYDPRLGRWKSLDPLMAQFAHMSPYVGFDNNPVLFTDPRGLATDDWVYTEAEGWVDDDRVHDQATFEEFYGNKPGATWGEPGTTHTLQGSDFKIKFTDNNVNGWELSGTDSEGAEYIAKKAPDAPKIENVEVQPEGRSIFDPLSGDNHLTTPNFLPDAISIEISFAGYVGPGTDFSLSVNWIIDGGVESSGVPFVTATSTPGAGWDISGGIGVVAHYKSGTDDLLRTDFASTKAPGSKYIDPGWKTSMSGALFGKIGITHSITPAGDNATLTSYGINAGVPVLPTIVNSYGGIPVTVILF
jgi:RHS repeat-associated protein